MTGATISVSFNGSSIAAAFRGLAQLGHDPAPLLRAIGAGLVETTAQRFERGVDPEGIGFVAGALAKLIMPGRSPGGFIVTVLLGVFGSVVATWLGRALGWYRGEQTAGFIGAVVGAVIILAVYRAILRNAARA